MGHYYTTRRIGNQVYQLFEKRGVSETLIVGKEQALLMDTGYGHRELIPEIRKITHKPILVMNSHLHPDHSNGNKLFPQVYVGQRDLPGDTPSADQELMNQVCKALEAKHDLTTLWKTLRRPAKKMLLGFATDLGDAQHMALPSEIDLGGRTLQIWDMPGHTPGSVMVLDPADRVIYTGDAINGNYWAFTNPSYSLAAYRAQVQEVACLAGYDEIWLAHQREQLPFAFVGFFAAFLGRIRVESSRKIHLPGVKEALHIYSEKHPEYGRVAVWYFPQQLAD